MRQYESAGAVSAAKILIVQRDSYSADATYLLVCAAPELGAGVSTYEEATSAWMEANGAEAGGYLVDLGVGDKRYIPAAAFEAIYTLVVTP